MFRHVFHHVIFNKRREIPFIIFFSFLVSFFIARGVAYSIYYDIVPDALFFIKTVYIKGYHIHHFNFGIALLVLSGFLSLVDSLRRHVRKIAMLYGIGLALIMDEFGLLITLDKNSYWNQRSYDAVIFTALILLNVVYFRRFWKVMGTQINKMVRRVRK